MSSVYSARKLALAISAFAVSQGVISTATQAAERLEEVVVTARHTEESAQQVPIASTNFTPEAMAEKAIFKLDDLSASTPSLQVTSGLGSNSTPWIGLRGQRQADTLVTLDPSVGVYLDDVYLGRTVGQLMDMVDMERIEVLKGPQGSLYGRNTTGGAIKLVTKKAEPTGDLSGYAKAGFGNYAAKRFEGGINIPLADTVAARLSVLSNTHDGYTDVTYVRALNGGNVTQPLVVVDKDTLDDADNKVARGNIVWEANESLTFTLAGDYSESKSNGQALVNVNGDIPTAFSPPQGGVSIPLGYRTSGSFHEVVLNTPRIDQDSIVRASGGSLTTEYEITPDLFSTLILAYREQTGKWYFDVDGNASNSLDQNVADSNQRQESAEWRFQGAALDDKLNWLLGLYYFSEHGIDFATSQNFGFLTTATNAIADNKSESIFTHMSYAFSDELTATVGLRYTEDTKKMETNGKNWAVGPLAFCPFVAPLDGFDAATCSLKRSTNYYYPSWMVGVDYKWSPEVMIYIKANNGSRSGGQNARGLSNATLEPFDREQVTDIEIGIKSSWLDDRLRLNADYYHTFYDDAQVTRTASVLVPVAGVGNVPAASTLTENASGGDFDGVEIELNALLTDQLSLDATLAYLKAELDPSSSTGQELVASAAPEWSGSLALMYKLPVSYGEWSFRGDTSIQSDYYGGAQKDDTNIIDGRAIYNARVALNLDAYGIELAAYGKNLTDKEYYGISTSVGSLPGLRFANLGAPRTYGIEATKRF